MAKKIQAQINLQIGAGRANPAPPIGPALGQQGVNIMKFCEAFNARTKDIEAGMPTPVAIIVYSDRSFTFTIKPPPAAYLILRAIGVSKGSSTPNKNKIGKITREQLAQIATLKMSGLTASNLDAAIRTIAGTARNMGVEVEGV